MSDDDIGLGAGDVRALEAAAGIWVREGGVPVTASERLKKIRAAGQRTAPVKAFVSDFKSQKPVSHWPSALVAGLMAGMLGLALAWSGTPQVTPRHPSQKIAAADGDAVVMGTADSESPALFRRGTGETWTRMLPGGKCFAGDWIQNASATTFNEIYLSSKRWVSLAPGTLIRLGTSDEPLRIELWSGTLSVSASPEHAVQLDQINGERRPVHYFTVVAENAQNNEYAYFEAQNGGTATIQLDGFALLDETLITPAVVKKLNRSPVRKAAPLDAGSGSLLKPASCTFEHKSLSEITTALQQSLGVNIRLSSDVEAAMGSELISFHVDDVTAAELLSRLAERMQLKMRVMNGAVLFELPPGKKSAPRKDSEF